MTQDHQSNNLVVVVPPVVVGRSNIVTMILELSKSCSVWCLEMPYSKER